MMRHKSVNVYVGYGWQKGKSEDGAAVKPEKDVIWTTIRDFFKATKEGVEKRDGVTINFRRLRANIGEVGLNNIVRMIENADVLIFDVDGMDKPIAYENRMVDCSKVLKEVNKNVLLEIGIAIGLKKRIVVLCPHHLRKAMTSDLGGIMLGLYSGKICASRFDRMFSDVKGTLGAFRKMITVAARKRKAEDPDKCEANEESNPEEVGRTK